MNNKNRLLNIPSALFIYVLVTLIACSKNDNSSVPGGGANTPISYRFTSPINIKITNFNSPCQVKPEFITTNYIFSDIGGSSGFFSVTRIPIGNSSGTIINSPSLGGGWPYISSPYNLCPNSSTYTRSLSTVDKNETYLYGLGLATSPSSPSITYMQIIKWNLTTNSCTKLLPDAPNALDILKGINLKCMRVSSDGTIYVASMANNGSIAKITPSGNMSFIANNLINPGFFDIYNSALYVPINSASAGKIIRIDQNNVITEIVQNITGPTNVAVDNYESLIVRTQTTIDGANYYQFDLYNMNGSIISNVKDASGLSILSNITENTPLSFDSNNNLYFYHGDGVSSGGITYNNPIGQKGLFKMGVIKN